MENDDHIKAIIELLKEILGELKNSCTNHLDSKPLDDLIDSVDVKSILKISDRTLHRIKQNNYIHTVRIGKRDYYSMAEIKSLIRLFMK